MEAIKPSASIAACLHACMQDLDEFQAHVLLKRLVSTSFKELLNATPAGHQLNADLEFVLQQVGPHSQQSRVGVQPAASS